MKELMRTKSKSSENSPPNFDCLPTQIKDMSYNDIRRLAIGLVDQTSDEFHTSLAARDYLRSNPTRLEKSKQAEIDRYKH